MNPQDKFIAKCVIAVIAAVFLLVPVGMIGCPQYKVYVQTKEGEAELKRAEQNRQIVVQTAQAKQEAAEYERQAEVIRATGVAEALAKVREELQTLTDEQARVLIYYKWVQGLNDESSQVIYVPTEANLPVLLEAGRIAQAEGPQDYGAAIEKELNRNVSEEDRESSQAVRE
jgi:hypothetical protein